MERGEKLALGVAVVGHAVLFGLLSVGFLATPNPEELTAKPIEVSLAEDVALEQASPNPTAEAAPSVAPEQGAPEDAAAPEPSPAAPEPEAAPQPAPAPPQPKPQPQPVPRPAKPAPAPTPAPRPKPQPPRPTPAAEPKPAPAKPAAKPAPAKPAATAPAKPAATKGSGKSPTATASRPRGSRLGDDFLKGLSDRDTPSRTEAAPAAKMGAQAAADIGSAILRQVQPCANRQVTPGPGAERIRVAINLKLNRDGSLAARPRVVGHSGVDDDNSRYVARVDDLAIATFVGCSPLRGLPEELYDVQNGWSSFTLRYKLPG
ncbi:cell envelope biogenesis protein TolA [Sphingomonas sp. 1P08PE]|uniref:cell envelope biogenesis protein TolA n=1 Tax=Sphingomonas sp. 1P08PE TaxID=554122 RepID=UPI0039A1079B